MALLARRLPGLCRRSAAPLSTAVHRGAQDFHELRERSLLRYTMKASTEGDATSVLNAMDEFWSEYYKGQSTTEWKLRGTAMDDAIQKAAPTAAMELGTYCGYSAIRIGRLLPPGGKLVSVEVDPLYAAIATKVIEHAGLSDSIKVEIGDISERFEAIQKKHGIGQIEALLMDHGTSNYLSSLQFLEGKGMVKQDTAVLCDWSLYPGSEDDTQAPLKMEEFMKHMEASGRAATARQTMHNKEVFSVNTWSGFPV
jgi:catechol O-methyltransferase